MKALMLTVLGGLALCIAGCQSPGKAGPFRAPPELLLKKAPSPLQEVLEDMPSITWERTSRYSPETDYLAVHGDPSYYLFRDGLQFIDERSALRYTADAGGFELLTIEQKDGLYKNPVCPADIFAFTCVESHSLIIATKITCSSMACDYDFVVFDYERKFRFLDDAPALKTIINFMLGEEEAVFYFPYRYNEEFVVKHRTSGDITEENPLWLEYMRDRCDRIQEKIDHAVLEHDIRILEQHAER